MNPSSTSAAGMSPTALGQQGTAQMQAGANIQGFGQIFGGISGFAQAMYQRQVAKINAKIAEQNELNALAKGESDSMRYGIQAKQRMGNIIAAQGSSGLDAASGSARDVQASQGKIAQMDMQQIRENAALVAYNYDAQKVSFQNQGNLALRSGINSLAEGGIKGLSSFVGGAYATHSKWILGQQVGLQPKQDDDEASTIRGGVGQDFVW